MKHTDYSHPKVILSANVSHYYYAALALARAHYLKSYICSIAIKKENHFIMNLLPSFWRKKLRGRYVGGIDARLIQSLWLAELLQRGLPYLGIISNERGNWLNNLLYDWAAQYYVDACDIFHFVSSIGLYSARRAKKRGGIIVCDIRTEFPEYQFRILREECFRMGISFDSPGLLYDKRIRDEFTISDYFIVPSRYAKNTFVQAGFHEKSIFVLPYGVDLGQFYMLGKNGDKRDYFRISFLNGKNFRIVYVGQITLRKGIHYLIKAFMNLGIKDAELWLVGTIDKTMNGIIEEALSKNSNIHATGDLPKTELYHVYNSGSVFVLPSLSDSWGLVVLEAMACGLPVIVSENTGSSEAVEEGINGFIIPIRDTETLCSRIRYLYENPDRRNEMAQAAFKTVSKFTWEQYGKGLIEIYNKIIEIRSR